MDKYQELADTIISYELKKLAGEITLPAAGSPKGNAPSAPTVGPQAAAKNKVVKWKSRKIKNAK